MSHTSFFIDFKYILLSHKVSRHRDNTQSKGCHSNPYSLYLDCLLDKSREVVPKVNE